MAGDLEAYPHSEPKGCGARHRSMHFGTRGGDARWAREGWSRHVEGRLTPARSETLRPGGVEGVGEYEDMLKARGVRPFDKRMILNARNGRLSLLNPRRVGAGDKRGSLGEFLRGMGCPCGGGPQTVRHLQRECGLEKVVERRERVLTCMRAIDDSSAHDQWAYAIRALEQPGSFPPSTSINRDADEHLLGIVVPSNKGAGANTKSKECGAFMRAMSGLLEEGVRVARVERRKGGRAFTRLEGLRAGLRALRVEALGAPPREVMELRGAREEQRVVRARLGQGGVTEGVVRACERGAWKVRVRHKRRWREVWVGEEEEVWIGGHIWLWRLARLARGWVEGFRRRRVDAADLSMAEAGLDEEMMGEELAAAVGVAQQAQTAALYATVRVREAARRVAAMVCGMVVKAIRKGDSGKKKKGRKGGKGGGRRGGGKHS